MLKYKLFGSVIQSKNKAKSIRKCIADTIKIQEDVEKLDLHDLTVKEGVLRQRKQDMTEAAKIIYQGDISDSKMFQLQKLFKEIECLHQECSSLSRTREALLGVQVAKDKEMASMILEKHILTEHYKQKIRRAIRPSLKSIGMKATRLQMDRELEQDIRGELSTFVKDEEVEESEEMDKDDQRFSDWLDTLKSSNGVKVSVESNDLKKRINEMKNRNQ
jgi:hypothetical protein